MSPPLLLARLGIDRLLRLLLALALASALWGYVTVSDATATVQTLANQVLTVRNLAGDVVLLTPLPPVDVIVAGPPELVRRPDSGIVAYIDLGQRRPGPSQPVAIQVDLPLGVRLVARNPDRVVVDLDPLVRAVLPVTLVLPVGSASSDPSAQPLVIPPTLSVTGARSTVGAVARVVVAPRPPAGRAGQTSVVRPIPLSDTGAEVSGPQFVLDPALVSVVWPVASAATSANARTALCTDNCQRAGGDATMALFLPDVAWRCYHSCCLPR